MFEDLFVRIPFERLLSQSDSPLPEKVNPEIYIDGDTLKKLNAARIKRVQRQLEPFSGLTLHAPFIDISPGAFDADVRRISIVKMDKMLDLAESWSAKLVVMHFNYNPIYYRQQFARWLDQAAVAYCQLLEPKRKPLIALENIAEPSPEIAKQLVERVNHPRLVHCFDFGHHHVFGRVPFDQWLKRLEPRHHIHFHVHDNHGRQDDHLPPGQGSINWQRARQAMTGPGILFSVALEVHSPQGVATGLDFYRKNFLR